MIQRYLFCLFLCTAVPPAGFSIYIFIHTVTFIGTSGHSVQMSWIFVSTHIFIFSLEIADIFSSPDPKGQVSYCHHWASVVRPLTFHILINSSEATGPIWTKLWWNSPWMAPFQNCVRWSRLPTKMAAKLKIEKRGDEILIVHCLNFNCSYMARSSLTIFRVFLWNFSFSRYIQIMQIRHILITDHI